MIENCRSEVVSAFEANPSVPEQGDRLRRIKINNCYATLYCYLSSLRLGGTDLGQITQQLVHQNAQCSRCNISNRTDIQAIFCKDIAMRI